MSPEQKMSKRQMMRQKRQRQARMQRIGMIAIIVVGALLVAAVLIYPNLRPVGEVAIPEPNTRPMANDNAMGDPNAPIRIEEFSDFQCPFCQKFYLETEPQIVEEYVKTGKVYFVYRSLGNFISDNVARSGGPRGTESIDAISAAYCAGDQGKFWEYHDILFANHTGEAVGDYTPRNLTAYAESINLDMNAFQSCFDSGKYQERATQDAVDGTAAGVTGTPAFFLTYTVNGEEKTRFINGAQPYSAFQTEIEGALAEMGLD